MKTISILFVLLMSLNIQAATVEYRSEFCQKETDSELEITMEDMGWGQTLKEMDSKFNTIYNEGKRLNYRAFISDQGFALPIKDSDEVVNITESFVSSIVTHIETALERRHADYIFFSDMGHSHMFVDINTYNEKVDPLEIKNFKGRYEIMLNDPKTKFLYHTAEQLQMHDEEKVLLEDREVQWRFYTRNIIGDNMSSPQLEVIHAHDSSHNTAQASHYDEHEEKYRYWGGGYAISASNKGCFAYKNKGETYYFDISLYDVAYNNIGENSGY